MRFENRLAGVAPQTILTDLLVDRIYPVEPREGSTPVARVKKWIVGARRGTAVYLGYRPRDDQSRSLGYDVRTLFEILNALGAYAAGSENDNTEHLSRTAPYLACRFPERRGGHRAAPAPPSKRTGPAGSPATKPPTAPGRSETPSPRTASGSKTSASTATPSPMTAHSP